MSTLVSVVIPCYRQARYLPEAIDSCLAQTHDNLEIIVVNDGSDDDTDQVARSYAERIHYIRRENGGLSAARNSAIQIAGGSHVKFLDADDHLDRECIARQISGLNGRANNVSLCTVRVYHEEEPARFIDVKPSFNSLFPDLFRQPDSATHAFLFPLASVKAIGGFSESTKIAVDWEFLSRLGRLRPTIVHDNYIGAFYRLRKGSMSQDRPAMWKAVARQLICMHNEFRAGEFREWFGSDLLGAEQRTYRRLLLLEARDRHLEGELIQCIQELRGQTKVPSLGWKFDVMCRVMGYDRAEHLYSHYVRTRHRLAATAP